MFIFVTIVIVIVSVLLGLIVLIQNPKGGGVNSTFGGASQQIFGAARTTDVVEKTTWGLAIALLAFCLFSAAFLGKTTTATAAGANGAATTTQGETEVEKRAKENPNLIPRSAPAQQAPAPQGQQAPAPPAK